MSKQKTRTLIRLCKLVFMAGIISACGNKQSEPIPNAPEIESGISKGLSNAKWVFQTPAGIYVQKAGEKASLLVEGGKWPRFSPDGNYVAFLKGNNVGWISLASKQTKVLAQTKQPKALLVTASGNEIWFTEGKEVKAVSVKTGKVRRLVSDGEFLEIDSGPKEQTLIATVKSFGYHVKIFDLKNDSNFSLGKGCSASFSPDGTRGTNNLEGHQQLAIVNTTNRDGNVEKKLPAPKGVFTDNQFWSNHPDWIASIDEDSGHILAHRVADGKVWKLSEMPNGDRPDLWLP